MNSNLIRQIFLSYSQGNKSKFLEIAEEIIRAEEKKSHHLLAKDLKDILRGISDGESISNNRIEKRFKNVQPIPRETETGFPLLEIKEFELDFTDVILKKELQLSVHDIMSEIQEFELLRAYGLYPKRKILFCGPPGTGKTLSAQVISSILRFPLVHIKFDSIISSLLGETATNLKRVFDFIEVGQWVVLFDEFDIIGKHRDDPHEHGEIKRVVNNFMQMLDNYNGESLLIAATNHQHLLDPGLWRRFDDILFFDYPDESGRKKIFEKYLSVLQKDANLSYSILINKTKGFSPADIAQVCIESLKTNIIKNKLKIDTEDLIYAIKCQNKRKKIKGRSNGTKI